MFYLPGMMFVVAIGQCMQLGSVNLAESTISAFIVAFFNAMSVLYLLHGLSYVAIYKQRFNSLGVFFRTRCARDARVASSQDSQTDGPSQHEPIVLTLPTLSPGKLLSSVPDAASALGTECPGPEIPSTDADGGVAMGRSRTPSSLEVASDSEGHLERGNGSSPPPPDPLDAVTVRGATSGSEPAAASLEASSDREGYVKRAAAFELDLDVGGTVVDGSLQSPRGYEGTGIQVADAMLGHHGEAHSPESLSNGNGSLAFQAPVSLEDEDQDEDEDVESSAAAQKRRTRSLMQHVQRHRRASVAMENKLEEQTLRKASTGSRLSRLVHRFSLRRSKLASVHMPASVVAMGTFVHNKIERSSFGSVASNFSSFAGFSSFGASFATNASGTSIGFIKSFFVRASEEEVVEIERIEVCSS
jgi:hypothetical protein